MNTASPVATVVDRPWAFTSACAGLIAILSYVSLIFAPVSDPVGVLLTAGFGVGFGAFTVAMYLGILRDVAPRTALAAGAANLLAGALLVAMILVQVAIKDMSPDRATVRALAPIHLGLDVAWDLYGALGTILLAWALREHRAFGVTFALPGLLLGLALLLLNVLTFPTPPAEAGLIDVGPAAGLWYLAVSIRVAVLVWKPLPSPSLA